MAKRIATYPVAPLIINRWSPRALSSELMTHNDLMSLFEAARWAQSSYNGQPWRFIYSRREDKYWPTFFNLLVPFNQSWAHNASYLIVVISRTHFVYNNEFSRTHSFDAGAACQNLALQGFLMGHVVHCMEGFDYDRVKLELNIPEEYMVEAMIAVGKLGDKKDLPLELQKREEPSDRYPLKDIVFEGFFNNKK